MAQAEGAGGEEASCSDCPVSMLERQVHILFVSVGWRERGKLHVQLREMYADRSLALSAFLQARCAGKVCIGAVLWLWLWVLL